MLFQVNHTEAGIDLNTEESFLDGEDFISFTFDNLEDQLIHYLNDDQKRNDIVNSAIQKLEDSYTYEKGFLSIIDHSKGFNHSERNNPQNQSHAFYNGIFYVATNFRGRDQDARWCNYWHTINPV